MPAFFGEDELTNDGAQRRKPEEQEIQDPITLDIDDDVLIRVIDDRIKKSEDYYNKTLNLQERRNVNKRYFVGDQLNLKSLKNHQARYIDNLIYEAEGTIKPIALSRLPDLIVKPGDETDEQEKSAEDLTEILNADIRQRENRRVLGMASKHLPVYFISCIKAIWDPEIGENGNYRFKIVHPENVVMDHTSATNDEVDMDFIAEATDLSVKEIIMRFSSKKKQILKVMGIDEKNPDEKKMASKQKIWEVWFTWYKETQDPEDGERKWERIEGVLWKYKNLLLAKMLNPYWDWTGKKRLFRFEQGKKRGLSSDEIERAILGETEGIKQDTVFNNHFRDPAKPYFFMGYDQWGDSPIDITSRIEQVLTLQDNTNKRGRQITEMNDRARGKFIFSSESGITKEDIENMDFDDPDQDIVVDGNIRETFDFMQSPPASAPMYTEQEQERNKAFSKMGTHSTTRGEINKGKPATSDFIAREQDFGRIDDLVEDTINPAAEWMASWAMQFVKLFYTEEHMVRLLGRDGTVTHKRLSSDSIADGMEVAVSASGVDKAQRKSEAFQRAQMQLTDPLTFFMDTDASDPVGRTKKLMTFLTAPELYLQQFVEKRDTEEMGDVLQQQPIEGQVPQAPQSQVAPSATPVIPQAPPPGQVPQGQGGGNPFQFVGVPRTNSFI